MHPLSMSPVSSSTPSPTTIVGPETRKMKKPLMEKRRRKRINDSLTWLKENLTHIAPVQRSKLEKADILEMTIDYIKTLQSGHSAVPDTAFTAYRRGMSDGFSQASKATFDFLNLTFPTHSIGGQQMQGALLRHLSAACAAVLPPVPTTPTPRPSVDAPPTTPVKPVIVEEVVDILTTTEESPVKKQKIWRPHLP